MTKSSGFTLLELMVVIAIIAITAATATPNLLNWRLNREFTSTLQRTISVLHSARTHAVKENAYAQIVFDRNNNDFRTFIDNSRDGIWNPDEDRHIDFFKIPPGVTITYCNFPLENQTQGRHRFRYNAQGVPVNAGRIELTNRSGRRVQVIVAPSGRIRTQ